MRPQVSRTSGEVQKAIYESCKALLDDLATKSSSALSLRCAARVLRIMQSTGTLDTSVIEYARVVQGDNKHGRDFARELDEESEK